jgi:hypothetical protein
MLCHGKSLSSGHWITDYALCYSWENCTRYGGPNGSRTAVRNKWAGTDLTYVSYLSHHFAGGAEE